LGCRVKVQGVGADHDISFEGVVQGFLAHKKTFPPYDHHRALGIGLQ
jgi:hypothetical protein